MSEEELTNGSGAETQPELLEVEAKPVEEAPAGEPEKALLEAQRQASENWDRFIRAQAEMENLRRRVEKDLQNAHKYALEKFAKELLPVMDSLELGIAASIADTPDVGAELTLKQFQNVFEKFGILAIDPVGEKFNPEQHQAMAMESAEGVEPNTVLKVFQKGYLLNDRLLRPALVVVAQA
jgi:molecular chaperone GrpE